MGHSNLHQFGAQDEGALQEANDGVQEIERRVLVDVWRLVDFDARPAALSFAVTTP